MFAAIEGGFGCHNGLHCSGESLVIFAFSFRNDLFIQIDRQIDRIDRACASKFQFIVLNRVQSLAFALAG